MLLKRIRQRREKSKRFAHIGAGIVILIHAYEKWDTGHGSYLSFAIAGVVFLAIAFFHHPLQKRFPWVDGVFFVIEGLLSLLVAYEMFHAGKKALPVTYLLLAFFQFFMAFRRSHKAIKKHQQPSFQNEASPASS